MDAEDVAQVADSLRQALRADPAAAGRVVEEFGWSELLDDEPQVAVSTLFALSGELLTTGSQLDAVMLRAAGSPALRTVGRVVLPALGESGPAGRYSGDGSVAVRGIVHQGEGPVVVPSVGDDGEIAFVVGDVAEAADDPIDPTARWRRTTGTVTVAHVVDRADLDGLPSEVWTRMLAAGRRALAHELVGVSGAMLTMTVEHVKSREQFGTALGSFQAVKHQLADVHLWREVAALSADAAWEDLGPQSAALAKAAAVRGSRTARAACQQLLGGMGFTWEHDFHRYLRRALTIEPLLGGAPALHADLGAGLRAGTVGHDLVAL